MKIPLSKTRKYLLRVHCTSKVLKFLLKAKEYYEFKLGFAKRPGRERQGLNFQIKDLVKD